MDSTETISRKQHNEEIRQLKEKYKPNNAFNIPVADVLDFFKWWCVFLRPFIPLTEREIDVVARLLKQRWELSKKIDDPSILDTLTMSSESLSKVVEDCGMNKQHFYVVMNSLKKKGAINERINPRLVPNMKEEGVFKLTILFKENSQQA